MRLVQYSVYFLPYHWKDTFLKQWPIMAHHFFNGAKLSTLNPEIYFLMFNYVLGEKQINNEYRNTLIYNTVPNQLIFCPMWRQNIMRNSATVISLFIYWLIDCYFAIWFPPTDCKLLKNYVIHCLNWLVLNFLTYTTLL